VALHGLQGNPEVKGGARVAWLYFKDAFASVGYPLKVTQARTDSRIDKPAIGVIPVTVKVRCTGFLRLPEAIVPHEFHDVLQGGIHLISIFQLDVLIGIDWLAGDGQAGCDLYPVL